MARIKVKKDPAQIRMQDIDWHLFITCAKLHWSSPDEMQLATHLTRHQCHGFWYRGQMTIAKLHKMCETMRIPAHKFKKGWKLNEPW